MMHPTGWARSICHSYDHRRDKDYRRLGKWHYFRAGLSICGLWHENYDYELLAKEQRDIEAEGNCRACVRRLKREMAR